MKPRFPAEWEVSSEELCILASWFLSPMSKNSVLKGLRVRRLAVIQEDIFSRAFWRSEMLESKLSGWKGKKSRYYNKQVNKYLRNGWITLEAYNNSQVKHLFLEIRGILQYLHRKMNNVSARCRQRIYWVSKTFKRQGYNHPQTSSWKWRGLAAPLWEPAHGPCSFAFLSDVDSTQVPTCRGSSHSLPSSSILLIHSPSFSIPLHCREAAPQIHLGVWGPL